MASQEQSLTLEDNSPKLSPDYASSTKSTSPSPKINPESQLSYFLLNEMQVARKPRLGLKSCDE